jgi:hypothetical protein
MSPWARAVGGVLKENGYTDFLANYGGHQAIVDPTRKALGILAAAMPGEALRPYEWARLAVEYGLARILFPVNERDTEKGRERAIGVIMSRHQDETFEASTETRRLKVRLEGGNRRWTSGGNPHVRYVFTVLEEGPIQVDDEDPTSNNNGSETSSPS